MFAPADPPKALPDISTEQEAERILALLGQLDSYIDSANAKIDELKESTRLQLSALSATLGNPGKPKPAEPTGSLYEDLLENGYENPADIIRIVATALREQNLWSSFAEAADWLEAQSTPVP